MHIRFTKMQGAGNDFVVLDETRGRLGLSHAQYRWLADRHFGVGADQILSVRPSPGPGLDFEYVIHNADGGEVEHCGNGARCFVRYVRDKGLTTANPVRVKVKQGEISLALNDDGRVTVDMGAPVFALDRVPFDARGLVSTPMGGFERWPLALHDGGEALVSVLSMGNPHAVQLVDNVDTAPVLSQGPQVELHARFPARVNAGFLQIVNRGQVRLRVYERGAGETLACGTGACAAVVAGIRLGLLDSKVDVQTQGGVLTIEWQDTPAHDAPVFMTGPATTVFEGDINVPDLA
ncbi:MULTISPECIES: diaminopimelate epimerase [Comamonadaceae]|jgi:diaminopimelate epimerase|uniref:diaminopimelate epimerase n=1 Tax=Comamonadaceae TaxID=80864 RepID=UPI002722D27D|nr:MULTISPECIES: diaminopimelate epimerase [Comamonadaceae]MDZ4359532.1 diaminopimelate epimerase [Variovorax sp.]MDO9253395.1 diaminopimelate epimerase [Hydrogenophaga sp.]MDP2442093.1 diaminopimelate epimerase [Rhodoferax sp.]MDP3324828.1 diaminopimelate epimerase [Hydrogenophaga sp.]MDP3886566.1 diaminopimelate epimerase [Hydrogenophaga sp.]